MMLNIPPVSWYTGPLVRYLAEVSVRIVLLFAAGAFVALLLRRTAPAVRHQLWTGVLVSVLVLPALTLCFPNHSLGLMNPWAVANVPATAADRISVTVPGSSSDERFTLSSLPRAVVVHEESSWPLYILTLYLAGVVFAAVRAWAGVAATCRLLRHSRAISEQVWTHLDVAGDDTGYFRIEESAYAMVPLTFGHDPVRIVLPPDWRDWNGTKLRAVLAHELAHAQRSDWCIQMAALINRTVFWFHPLAWWLEGHLKRLAEYSADETALISCGDAAGYANVLLDFAGSSTRLDRRLAWNTAPMAGTSDLARRIDHILETSRPMKRLNWLHRGLLWCVTACLLYFVAGVETRHAAWAQTLVSKESPFSAPRWAGYQSDELNPNEKLFGPDTAFRLEQQLASDPGNDEVRGALLRYYWRNGLHAERVRSIFWLIQNHPESPLHARTTAAILSGPYHAFDLAGHDSECTVNTADDFRLARELWQAAVKTHPEDATVLFNAARTIPVTTIAEANERFELLNRAQQLRPDLYTNAAAHEYFMELLGSPQLARIASRETRDAPASQVMSQLNASKDARLVGAVATEIVTIAGQRSLNGDYDINRLRDLALTLTGRAQMLDPQNQRWSDLMEGAKRLGTPLFSSSGIQRIRVGAAVQASRLVESHAPEYPALARQARIEGSVRLQLLIGADGHVQNLTLVSGHPLLVQPAMEAVRQYVYEPTYLNNNAAEVITTVDVTFTLAQ